MEKIKPKTYTKAKKLLCDSTDKMKCFVLYRMVNCYVRHGMIVDEIQELFHLNKVCGWENI